MRLHRQRSSLGSEQFELHVGHPSFGVLHREDKPPWLVGGQVGLIGRLGESQIQLGRSAHMLVHSQNRAERADRNFMGG